MKDKIITIAIHPAYLKRLEGIAKNGDITTEKVIERAIIFFIGSHHVTQDELNEFHLKIAKATYDKNGN